ncbi:related to cyclin-dependent kinase E-1 [Phialocephala subalpina]|uniref:Serine/threonine-protein kinase SSN3 n=1 Tax=Phialocephala subalpina TaxID=576137 RepID=A0A1L7XBR1_9HELO|nr:related to cyclin-dependent kinase E-1 [Phialocephala subalpina]
MSNATPPSTSSGPESVSGHRTQSIKRNLPATFEDPLDRGKARARIGYKCKTSILDSYSVVGFISSGTYGRVYKALGQPGHNLPGEFAIKKFKADKEGEKLAYTGISQSAIREMSLCSDLNHVNIIKLVETILEEKSIFMIFEYAEHDLLQIIHHHTQLPRQQIPPSMIKSIMFQLINGCRYLHSNWILHRDLKPANIMVTSSGVVKIGDFGLARCFHKPLQPLFSGDKVVVTIWYRAPELLLGSWHYDPAVDMWAVGCIFAELLALRPIFKGEEAKAESKRVPFQRSQMQKIIDILDMPTKDQWPLITSMPEYNQLSSLQPHLSQSSRAQNQKHQSPRSLSNQSNLDKWYYSITRANAGNDTSGSESLKALGVDGYKLLADLLEYNPERRLTAEQALGYPLLHVQSKVSMNCFDGLSIEYPHRRVKQDDTDIRPGSLPVMK